ncbi:MAG: twin-arginine translocase TatA/TatE family subunit [Rubrobacter sp.]|jgi:Sec-independent protein translocase protein TatA|nr:twin-arginine translocase TatA/TatE family subunit [Rubrobacter sp.]MBA3952526.1 twin-arginine translocase TatA/TatE family subunit [Rubrobacter sp.]MDQ3360609.1 twin-arginine translocase TatA/TatE family subunit [Actinomycetota bacterium]MDQ3377741.1 twin-arginine translocase TatA/TatE family subunit [Actinomycetota bacterium]
MTLGLIEILLVVMVFLFLGPRRIADLFRSLGRGVHDFVDTLGRDKKQKEIEDPEDEEPPSRKQ